MEKDILYIEYNFEEGDNKELMKEFYKRPFYIIFMVVFPILAITLIETMYILLGLTEGFSTFNIVMMCVFPCLMVLVLIPTPYLAPKIIKSKFTEDIFKSNYLVKIDTNGLTVNRKNQDLYIVWNYLLVVKESKKFINFYMKGFGLPKTLQYPIIAIPKRVLTVDQIQFIESIALKNLDRKKVKFYSNKMSNMGEK